MGERRARVNTITAAKVAFFEIKSAGMLYFNLQVRK